MAMRQSILRTEARHHHIWSELPDHPNHIGQNFVVVPEVHGLLSRFRKAEIDCSREELFAMVDASRCQQLLRSNTAEPLAQFRSDQVLTAVPACDRKIGGVIKGA